ncbi:hypothetical protein HYPSUDRAFT_683495 [Hypholoma sublateritium FD-334 SS-4]|uniref:Uncharacterized protein n=1 Tax=Hypholoma sublateritium (strain FD-334 SS-4) TaxID=945553 RepID=A0A0D2L4Q2_HYPSF|nr:hypothetical protein HYPSUDRAFT_683495 [Hypholoma sublateritium FD-334 SS-4]
MEEILSVCYRLIGGRSMAHDAEVAEATISNLLFPTVISLRPITMLIVSISGGTLFPTILVVPIYDCRYNLLEQQL